MWQEVQLSSLEKSPERETCLFMFSRNSWFSIRSPQKLIALAAIVKWTFICRSFLIGRPKAKSPTRSGSGAKGPKNWPVEQNNHRIAIRFGFCVMFFLNFFPLNQFESVWIPSDSGDCVSTTRFQSYVPMRNACPCRQSSWGHHGQFCQTHSVRDELCAKARRKWRKMAQNG